MSATFIFGLFLAITFFSAGIAIGGTFFSFRKKDSPPAAPPPDSERPAPAEPAPTPAPPPPRGPSPTPRPPAARAAAAPGPELPRPAVPARPQRQIAGGLQRPHA